MNWWSYLKYKSSLQEYMDYYIWFSFLVYFTAPCSHTRLCTGYIKEKSVLVVHSWRIREIISWNDFWITWFSVAHAFLITICKDFRREPYDLYTWKPILFYIKVRKKYKLWVLPSCIEYMPLPTYDLIPSLLPSFLPSSLPSSLSSFSPPHCLLFLLLSLLQLESWERNEKRGLGELCVRSGQSLLNWPLAIMRIKKVFLTFPCQLPLPAHFLNNGSPWASPWAIEAAAMLFLFTNNSVSTVGIFCISYGMAEMWAFQNIVTIHIKKTQLTPISRA